MVDVFGRSRKCKRPGQHQVFSCVDEGLVDHLRGPRNPVVEVGEQRRELPTILRLRTRREGARVATTSRTLRPCVTRGDCPRHGRPRSAFVESTPKPETASVFGNLFADRRSTYGDGAMPLRGNANRPVMSLRYDLSPLRAR